jgi:hypothetical protein
VCLSVSTSTRLSKSDLYADLADSRPLRDCPDRFHEVRQRRNGTPIIHLKPAIATSWTLLSGPRAREVCAERNCQFESASLAAEVKCGDLAEVDERFCLILHNLPKEEKRTRRHAARFCKHIRVIRAAIFTDFPGAVSPGFGSQPERSPWGSNLC